ncbi:hypothetical protein AGDE_15492 [Angomonas deanei]|uniref:Uncharacterized protein n=1 Tax=Angomonas deanei TaxID=59799 RepID=A0A7G2C5I2_9TRYP|nr:hypothetical protein AGDE_15492 [Angomonas deanei]CAD2214391.1 hypothetical protein, conserved [Angomonas deanei]|eukprot:EPY18969.1 hypothetical protein AGDE_15492 [Angomonas deanei]
MVRRNEFGQPIGKAVDPIVFSPPYVEVLEGRYCRLEHVNVERHAEALFNNVYSSDCDPRVLTYMPLEPYKDLASFKARCQYMQDSRDPFFFTIFDKDHGGKWWEVFPTPASTSPVGLRRWRG